MPKVPCPAGDALGIEPMALETLDHVDHPGIRLRRQRITARAPYVGHKAKLGIVHHADQRAGGMLAFYAVDADAAFAVGQDFLVRDLDDRRLARLALQFVHDHGMGRAEYPLEVRRAPLPTMTVAPSAT